MPPAAKTPGLDPAIEAEVRVARAWFWDGHYVRRGVDLQHRFGSDVLTVTDLDVLGISFEPTLVAHKRIGEVKSGTSKSTPRPLDRALWLRGLREVVGAESGEITTAFKASGVTRDVCSRLGVTIQHFDELSTRELRLRISDVNDVGSQGQTIALLRAEVASFAKSDAMLERGYWFLVSEVWFLEPFDALKRTLGLIRQLSKTWPPDSDVQANRAARWYLAEAISIATVNLAIVAGQANTMDPKAFAGTAVARLSSGDIPYYAMRALSDRVDEYVGKLLASLKAPAEMQASALGAFLPSPPAYAEPLLELISRFAAEAAATSRLPRQLDAIVFERLVHRRELTRDIHERLNLTPATERLIRLLAAFLRGQFNLADAVDRVLTAPLVPRPDSAPPEQKQLTFSDASGNATDASPDTPLQVEMPESKTENPSDTSHGSVIPKIEDADSSTVRENTTRFQTRRWHLVLENKTDSPLMDVEFRYENTDGTPANDFDVLAGKHDRTDILGPFESVRFPLVQSFGSPTSAICVVEWNDKEGARRCTQTTVRIP